MINNWIFNLAFLLGVVGCVIAEGFYGKSEVLELNPDSFREVVLTTNYTSVVEFYAPWCGHCNNFKFGYKKAARQLKDLINVYAVNCDLQINKPLCAEYKIEGFPTVKIFRPPKYSEKDPPKSKKQVIRGFANENYNGERTAKGIVQFAQARIKNYVKRIFSDDGLKSFLRANQDKVKLILLSDSKNKPSLFLKSLAIDYLGVVDFAYFDIKNSFTKTHIKESLNLSESEIEKPTFFVYGHGDTFEGPRLFTNDITKKNLHDYLSAEFSIDPVEGPGSEKHLVLDYLKQGKKLSEIKKILRASKKEAKQKAKPENAEALRDEL